MKWIIRGSRGLGAVLVCAACCTTEAAVTNAPAVPPDMVPIPAGINRGTDMSQGAYSLIVEAFYMDEKEVTKAKWDEVYAWAITNGYTFANTGSGKAANHPVHSVSWYDCAKWCNARSEKEGKTPCYNQRDWGCNFSADGYRLPTVTEWEYAARGGLRNNLFPWGDMIDHTQANYYGCPSVYTYDKGYEGFDTKYATGDFPYTSPSGSFAANGYGLYDMAGNVWEWCNDTAGQFRHIRGGGWNGEASLARCRDSGWNDPLVARSSYGFRTVCR